MKNPFIPLIILALCIAIPAYAQQLNGPVAPVHSTSNEKGHVLKASAGNLYHLSVANASSTAGFVALLNDTAVPSDGTIAPVACYALPANGTAEISFIPTPAMYFSTGITAVATSAAACTTMTSGTITAFFTALLQ